MAKIKKGDDIIVRTGKDKGKSGRVNPDFKKVIRFWLKELTRLRRTKNRIPMQVSRAG